MDELRAIEFFKLDTAVLRKELKDSTGITTMISALESRMNAEELAIEALQERLKGRWISINEKEPDCDCIVYEANSKRVLFSYAEEWDADDWNVTHWQPLPAAPKM